MQRIFALIPSIFSVLAVHDFPKCIMTRDRYVRQFLRAITVFVSEENGVSINNVHVFYVQTDKVYNIGFVRLALWSSTKMSSIVLANHLKEITLLYQK